MDGISYAIAGQLEANAASATVRLQVGELGRVPLQRAPPSCNLGLVIPHGGPKALRAGESLIGREHGRLAVSC